MPIRRLTSLEQAEEQCWLDPEDPLLPRRIAAVWSLAHRLFSHRFPPGVHKYRSIEELNRQVEAWETQDQRI